MISTITGSPHSSFARRCLDIKISTELSGDDVGMSPSGVVAGATLALLGRAGSVLWRLYNGDCIIFPF